MDGSDTVDVAIVCVGSAGNVVRYPASVFDGMKPRYVVLGHWENFFHPASADPGVIPFTDTKELERLMEQRAPRQWATPAPRTTFTFVY